MASLGTHLPLGGKISFAHFDRTHMNSHMTSSLSVFNHTKILKKAAPLQRISASMALSNSPSITEDFRAKDNPSGAIFPGMIDEWMEESVNDIIQNLKQAPLLVQVHRELNGQGNSKPEFRTEKAVEENWPFMKGEWKREETKSPDGLMFVDELVAEEEIGNGLNGKVTDQEEEGITKAWGIVVQGKGVECGPACYLLKTSRVGAGLGLGVFCTHFCLMRVTNFRENALGQLKHSWLLQ